MSDAPETIWAKGEKGFEGYAGTWLDESDGPDMVEYIRADLCVTLDAARVGAALREAAKAAADAAETVLLRNEPEVNALKRQITRRVVESPIEALAPDATAALDRALEQMRERCAQEAQYIATVGDGQSIAAAIRALPLHEEPET